MLANLFDGVSLWRFVIEYFLDDVSSLLRNAVVKRIFSSKHLFIKSVGVLILKRKVSIEHGKENDSAGPDINLNTIVSFALYHLRSRITRWTTWGLEQFTLLISVTEPKINNLQRVIISKQYILRLEIPVCYIDFPHILNTIDKLMKKFPSLVFLNTLILDNVVKELSVLHVLHD